MELTPLPGDPSYVETQAAVMVTAADRMVQAASTLRSLMNRADYQSEAVSAIAVNADDLASVMTKASVRYRGTGEALTEYAQVLDAAQQQANRAIGQEGDTDVWGARGNLAGKEAQAAVDFANPLLSEDAREQGRQELAEARHHLAQQEAQSANAVALYEDARRDVEHAAAVAMQKIHDSLEASGLNDSFWDDFEGFKDEYLVPILNAVVEVLGKVNQILGVLAIVLAFVPGLQGLAAALKSLSLILTLVSFAATVMLAVLGERTVGEVLAASLVLAASMVKLKGPAKKVGGFEDEKNLKDSSHYLFTKLKNEDPDWQNGGRAVLEFGIDKGTDLAAHAALPTDVADFLVDPIGAEAKSLGNTVDSLIPADQQPNTDHLATQDVQPVGNDFSSVNVDAIISERFGAQSQRSGAVPCSSGGGGGW